MAETLPAAPPTPDRERQSAGHVEAALHAWFERLASYHDIRFMADGRQQPPMPPSGGEWFDD